MISLIAYTVLVGAVALERVAELVVSQRNAAWSKRNGGVEYGRGHYPAMVLLHTGLLAGCLTEAWLTDRPFIPLLGGTMFLVVLGAQGLRWWCIATLGRRWNTRVIVIPGLPLITSGPYRLMRHPNYLAVIIEGAALPLVHGAWLTAAVFALLNLPLLRIRIRCEQAALDAAARP